MAAFSSAGQVRRRPAPVNTSMRRARSDPGISSDIDMCRSSKPAPNVTPHAWLRKALPRRRLLMLVDRSGLIGKERLENAGWPLAELSRVHDFQKGKKGQKFRARVDHPEDSYWFDALL